MIQISCAAITNVDKRPHAAARSAGGVWVVEVRHAANGRVTHTRRRRLPILSDAAADTLANRHISRCQAHGGYLACPHCLLRGVWDGGMYFVGYSSPTAGGVQSDPSAVLCTTMISSCRRSDMCSGYKAPHGQYASSLSCAAFMCV